MGFAFRLRQELERRGLIWHQEDERQPHVILSGGRTHANGFAHIQRFLTEPLALSQVAVEIHNRLEQVLGNQAPRLRWVIGSAYGSITLASEVARQFCSCGRSQVRAGFTKKARNGAMVCDLPIEAGDLVAFVEDMETSGYNAAESIKAVLAIQPKADVLATIIAVLAWNDSLPFLPSYKLIALLRDSMNTWTPEECQVYGPCSKGSEALHPKSPVSNWALLNPNNG